MKRWIRFVALFYPRGWREDFGDEFDSVLEDVRPGWRVFANVLKGAVEMQISEGAGWMKFVGTTAAVGALVALGMSFMASQQNYRSSATLTVTPQTDPVRAESPEVRQQRALAHVNEMREEILSRSSLSAIINDPSLDLYRTELPGKTLPEVIDHMRRDLSVRVMPPANDASGPILLSISFFYPDRREAEVVVRKLTNKFVEQSQNENRAQANAYNGFWGDMSQLKHVPPAPPPPVGEVVRFSRGTPPIPLTPNRVIFLVCGLLAGLLVGFAIRWPRSFFRLAGFALAGFILAAAVSYLFPNRFTSTAEMQILPAQLTEDPLASPPPVTPATEFLKQIEPQLLSEGLASIIEDRRIGLYSEERKRKPMEEIVREMGTNLRITPVDPTPGAASAFLISFTYPDRFKAQQTVEAVMSRIADAHWNHMKDASKSFAAHVIWERHAGEILDVLDTANLPQEPDGPPRPFIAMGGLGVGVLFGVFRLWRRRPDPLPLPSVQGGSVSEYA